MIISAGGIFFKPEDESSGRLGMGNKNMSIDPNAISGQNTDASVVADGEANTVSHNDIDANIAEVNAEVNTEQAHELSETSSLSLKKPPEITGIISDNDKIAKRLDSYERWAVRRKKAPKRRERMLKVWNKLCPILVAICSVILAVLVISAVGKIIVRKLIMPVDPNDPTPIVVEIPSGSGASTIAKILYEAGGEDQEGLISFKAAFKIYVDFKGLSGKLKAGTYVLSRNMDISQMVDIICEGNPPRATTTFTISEGMTIDAIAAKLVSLDILESPDRFLELCVTGDAFKNEYTFISGIEMGGTEKRPYALEGYLFPDTYEIFVDASEEDIINKMLTRFLNIYSSTYAERAEELGLSMDDVVILASMIEKEAKTFDFAKVSAVFANRLATDMSLGSDATLEYIFRTGSLSLTEEQLSDPTLYNTHLYKGLPLGPISNPGLVAIEAVLYPDEQFITDGFLYFCLMDSETGALVFAKTIEEHNANVELYSPNW